MASLCAITSPHSRGRWGDQITDMYLPLGFAPLNSTPEKSRCSHLFIKQKTSANPNSGRGRNEICPVFGLLQTVPFGQGALHTNFHSAELALKSVGIRAPRLPESLRVAGVWSPGAEQGVRETLGWELLLASTCENRWWEIWPWERIGSP